MSNWKVVVPEATENMCLNPSAEIAGNFAAVGGGTMTRSSTYSRYGLYSYRVVTAADNQGGSLTLSALSNNIHYVTLQVRGTLPTAWDWSLDGATYNAPSLLEQIDSNWARYGFQFPAAQANGSVLLEIRQSGAGAGDFYVDAVQVEQLTYWTTYCDGDQQGCEWNGAEHASTSSRSAASRAGGRVYDLQDDYDFDIEGMIGLGTAPRSVIVDEYAVLPGGELNVVKVHPRPFTLTGVVRGTGYADLTSKLTDLEDVLATDVSQGVRLQYWGSTVHKEIRCLYEGGMEGNVGSRGACYWQKMGVRFIAEDPYFYSIGGSGEGGGGEAMLLDSNDSATFRIVAARLRSTGQWDELGPPNAAGTYNWIHALAEDDIYIYFGGSFLNFDNIANADNIVRYNKATRAYSALGTGTNGAVYTLTVGPDGTLYAGGAFTLAGGVANTAYVAQWDGAVWAPLGTGANNTVYSLVVGLDGLLYAGGAFNVIGGIGANYIAEWNGAAWAALGVGMNGAVITVAVALDGTLYAGGSFTTAGGAGANRVAEWDGSAWSPLGTGLNNDAYFIVVGANGIVYVGGTFITAGGVTVNYIAQWNGTAWSDLAGGTNANVRGLAIGDDNMLYASGAFSQAGGIDLTNCVAKWNGASWAHLDIDLPGSPPLIYEILVSPPDPVVSDNYDIWLGFSATGTGYFAGLVTATNDGSQAVHPRIIVERSGGTSAVLETVRNETTGMELLFDYSLLDGERLTIDLRPTRQSIVSSMFGSRPDAILANSDMGGFTLEPGDNDVSCFVNVAGAPTVTAWLEWQATFKGL